jgi:dTDP-4-dehydrorhamnose reductase
MRPLEMWGGVECTVNRVGDEWRDQLRDSGHDLRLDDLDRFARLGLRRLRYPALWERTAPHAPDRFDWRWLDQRLTRLQQLAIEPILGLLHHGSGPHYTNLLDERFPELFAEYASAVAMRFPHIDHYTPINEPLTTARFSALYGHLYPHRCDDTSFARALVNQTRATTLAMQAIRRVNSAAQLIQTDDLGCTTSTPQLAYQADFDNERRWLGWDLLRGAVDRQHAMWTYLRQAGIEAAELDWFQIDTWMQTSPATHPSDEAGMVVTRTWMSRRFASPAPAQQAWAMRSLQPGHVIEARSQSLRCIWVALGKINCAGCTSFGAQRTRPVPRASRFAQ